MQSLLSFSVTVGSSVLKSRPSSKPPIHLKYFLPDRSPDPPHCSRRRWESEEVVDVVSFRCGVSVRVGFTKERGLVRETGGDRTGKDRGSPTDL